jgi:coenzyme F420 hydrogenase subunit beta
MNALSLQVHGRLPDEYLFGVYERVRVCYAANKNVRQDAASGGVVPVALQHLFAEGKIDVAYCLVPGRGPYDAKGRILRSADELGLIHGSVYHPFDYGKELRELIHGTVRFAIVGLPCQIEGIEMIKARRADLARRHVLSIGLFCGGVNRFEGIAYYLKAFGVEWNDLTEIEYRYGDWPGQIRVRRSSDDEAIRIPRIQGNSRWKILRYMAAFQGYWMMKRCRLCPDQLSDFADFSVGDPHIPKYRNLRGPGFSVVVTRTPRGEDLIRQLVETGELEEEDADTELVQLSQGYTLDNRRHVLAYIRVGRMLGLDTPELSLYPNVEKNVSFRHYKYALVDLVKIALRKCTFLRPFYLFLQALEYLFISFYPSLIYKRLCRLISNMGIK